MLLLSRHAVCLWSQQNAGPEIISVPLWTTAVRAVRESSMDSRDKGGWGAWFEGDHRQEKQRSGTR